MLYLLPLNTLASAFTEVLAQEADEAGLGYKGKERCDCELFE